MGATPVWEASRADGARYDPFVGRTSMGRSPMADTSMKWGGVMGLPPVWGPSTAAGMLVAVDSPCADFVWLDSMWPSSVWPSSVRPGSAWSGDRGAGAVAAVGSGY